MAFNSATPIQSFVPSPQPYVNINPVTPVPSYYQGQNGIFTRFVSSEAEAASMPNPAVGCSFYVDGEKLVLYAKYADGRPMEIYDLVQRNASAPTTQYVTEEMMNKILDKRFEEMSKKFVIRKERNNG